MLGDDEIYREHLRVIYNGRVAFIHRAATREMIAEQKILLTRRRELTLVGEP